MSSKSERIKNIASKVGNLPILPTVVAKMIDLADDPETQTETLARLISNDQSLTARILKAANSAYYGLSREISTVDTAIVVMGYKAVKEIGLSLSVVDSLKNMGSINRFDIQKYWEHCLGVGTAAKEIAKKYLSTDAGELYVAGLLHDIGKTILIQYAQQDFYSVLDYMEQENISCFEAEEQILGITHGEIGYIIADRWNLPVKIGMIIRHHHYPQNAPKNFTAEAAIIDTADTLCHNLNIGNANHRVNKNINPQIIQIFDKTNSFDASEITLIGKTLKTEIEQNELLHFTN
ncbi:MAG: HDOD domain-containing protein [Chitinispirillales bacterium]|jgi:putative nucleotidyltransferase with HDIG domain|nr:HDOD domain-containing protein [Chitinispirillales bacterium]